MGFGVLGFWGFGVYHLIKNWKPPNQQTCTSLRLRVWVPQPFSLCLRPSSLVGWSVRWTNWVECWSKSWGLFELRSVWSLVGTIRLDLLWIGTNWASWNRSGSLQLESSLVWVGAGLLWSSCWTFDLIHLSSSWDSTIPLEIKLHFEKRLELIDEVFKIAELLTNSMHNWSSLTLRLVKLKAFLIKHAQILLLTIQTFESTKA